MQREDKLVDGPDVAQAEKEQRAEIEAQGEETLPAAVVEAVQGAALDQRGELLGAVRMILAGDALTTSELGLPPREARALEALQIAVEGRGDLGQFVYAEDRRDLLEQALAVLQPGLMYLGGVAAHEIAGQLADIGQRVGALRAHLTRLDDAQEELLEDGQKAALEAAAAEAADKPKPAPVDPDAPRPATTLTGPDLPATPPPPSTLAGPGPDVRPSPAPTTLTGPDLREPPRPPSTLAGPGPDVVPSPPPTTLTGPDLAAPPRPPSTLSEPGPATPATDEGAKKSWWRKPFG